MLNLILRIVIIISGMYLIYKLGIYDVLFNISYAEEYNPYLKTRSEWDIRYEDGYAFATDLILFTAWWGIILIGALYR